MQDNAIHSRWAQLVANFPVQGAYHWLTPGIDPIAQAENYVEMVRPLLSDAMILALDWEEKPADGHQAKHLNDTLAFIAKVEAETGKSIIIYTGLDFLQFMSKHVALPLSLGKKTLWYAEYGVTAPKIAPPWTDWQFWQHSDGSDGGYGIDLNYFNGSLDELKVIAKA